VESAKLQAHFEGFRLVLIGNRYQLPVLQMNLDPFDLNASDWSSEASLPRLPTWKMLTLREFQTAKGHEFNWHCD